MLVITLLLIKLLQTKILLIFVPENERRLWRINLFNHSSYVQQLAWLVWIHTDKVATKADFDAAYQDIIDQNTPLFEKQTENLTTYQMNFLRAITDGVQEEFTSQENLQKYQLGSSANVSTIKRALVNKELIEVEKRRVTIPDPVLAQWLKREFEM